MRYADQHVHTTCSFDAVDTLPDMARAARAAGLSLVCFTDHMDMAEETTGRTAPDVEGRWSAFEARRALWAETEAPGLEVRFGMELGEPAQAPEEAAKAAAKPGLDLVLASVHNLPGEPDFFYQRYRSEERCEELNHRYLRELLRTAALDCFDVLSHLTYTARDMGRQGFHERITLEKYGDELRELFLLLIDRGKGIECNTSGFRNGGTFPYPDGEILRYYRSLGGEIITVGSDAHSVKQPGMRIPEIYELLKACSFRAVCEFRARRPEFIALD